MLLLRLLFDYLLSLCPFLRLLVLVARFDLALSGLFAELRIFLGLSLALLIASMPFLEFDALLLRELLDSVLDLVADGLDEGAKSFLLLD